MPTSPPITFVIPGQRVSRLRGAGGVAPLPADLRHGTVEASVRVAASRDAGVVRVDAVPGVHVVALAIDGGPELILHPETARDLLNAQDRAGSRGAAATGGDVAVPPTLRWPSPSQDGPLARGRMSDRLGGIVVRTVELLKGAADAATEALLDGVAGKLTDLAKDKAAALAARTLGARVDGQVVEGVHRLTPSALDLTAPIERLAPSTKELLVFIHGTFSSTAGGFGKLWSENPGHVASLFDYYGEHVYGLDHPTLCASPIQNALTLAEALPPDARLHLVTHSRGGLVAETLARLCASPVVAARDLAAFPLEQQEQFTRLARLVKQRRLRVERVVRVGSPIRGTLLASRRLDVYLSVLKWSMRLAGWPIASEVVDFLGAVARYRLEPEALPGLEAQVPGSPLVQWLHADPRPIPGDLRVIAGDITGDSVTGWIKTLMSDGFYWTDNDLVVQTRSMYGGAARQGGALFALDQSGQVLHTKYFAKDRAAGAICRALLEAQPRDFRKVGPLSWAGESASGDRGRRTAPSRRSAPASTRPAVILIPGVAASRLSRPTRADGSRAPDPVWPTTMALPTLERLGDTGAAPLLADGFVGTGFDELELALAATHDVIRFPYDWRVPLEVEAGRLAARVELALKEREESRQPVRLLTHSSGALLARSLHCAHGPLWARLMAHPDARVLMLAPPNAGLWLPMQVLSGDETFGGLLTAGAPPLREPQVRDAFGAMPGLLQLQASLLDPTLALHEPASWARLAALDARRTGVVCPWHDSPEQQALERWGTVSHSALNTAVAWRRRLDASLDELTAAWADRVAIVAGLGYPTPAGLPERVLADDAPEAGGLVYLHTDNGDGRVTVGSALLPGVAAWSVRSDHASLPGLDDARGSYIELLVRGTTTGLKRLELARPVAEVLTPARASRGLAATPPEDEGQILMAPAAAAPPAAVRRQLKVRVVNGDLTFVPGAMVVGHYRSTRLTGTEAVLDRLLGGAMSRSLALDVYATQPEACEIFVNTHHADDDRIRAPRPEAVVVVGLGEEGSLTAAELVRTVRKGVIAWARRLAERRDPPAPTVFDFAATLIGSGGKGMAAAEVATLLTEAVSDADESLDAGGLPRVGEFRIIELFADRAAEAWRALMLQAQQAPDRYEVAATIEPGTGSLRRPPETNYRGVDYDFVTIVTVGSERGSELAFSLDTRRARTEVTHQMAQRPLLLQLLENSDLQPGPQDIGRTLFNVLVPIQVEPFLGGSTDIVLELDRGTAGIPWELLDTNAGARQHSEPWAIRSKIVRKLRIDAPELPRRDATADDHVLVIGEPRCDEKKYQRLPGARREAAAVAQTLRNHGRGPRVVDLIAPDDPDLFGPDSVQVLSALHQHAYRIIHIAGHGEPTLTATQIGGVVLSPGADGTPAFLSASEVRGLRVVPELVFVNSCHVGARERLQLLVPGDPLVHRYNRPAFAADMAGALIEIGVRCVVVAGWAVDDRVAETFARTFYDALLAGETFLSATSEARRQAWKLDRRGTTWAAFQCWGDPEWRYRGPAASRYATDWARRHASVASAESLVIALETIATAARYDAVNDEAGVRREDRRVGLADLERGCAATWGAFGRVAAAFGDAWAENGDFDKAVQWYQRAVTAEDGGAPLRAAEQLSNMRVRLAWRAVTRLHADAGRSARTATLAQAAAQIEQEIVQATTLQQLRPTSEQASLLGAACKRLAMVRAELADADGEQQAVRRMRDAYRLAEQLAVKDDLNVFYPAWNRLVGEAADGAGHAGALDAATVAACRQLLERKNRVDADFWSVVGLIELRMLEAVAAGTLAAASGLVAEFLALGERVPSPRLWASVLDNSRFVLTRYQRRLGGRPAATGRAAELDAITRLLCTLAGLAGDPPSTVAAGAPRRRRARTAASGARRLTARPRARRPAASSGARRRVRKPRRG